MASEKKIKILPGGPYEVTDDIPLRQAKIEIDREGTSLGWADGREYKDHPKQTDDPHEPYHLCRCGRSEKKPYCDGTHNAIDFEGAETAGHRPYGEGAEVYDGGPEGVKLVDQESLCASLRFCDRGKGVWQAALDSADEESRRLAVEETCNCAAGRLTVLEEGAATEPGLPQEVSPVEDTAARWKGPLWVKGGIPIEGADGTQYEVRNRVTLCRCGESSNMPFCDTSHLRYPHMKGLDD